MDNTFYSHEGHHKGIYCQGDSPQIAEKSRAVTTGSLLAKSAPAVVELCGSGHGLGGVVVRVGRPSGISVSGGGGGRRSEFGRDAGLIQPCQGGGEASGSTNGIHVVCDQQSYFKNPGLGHAEEQSLRHLYPFSSCLLIERSLTDHQHEVLPTPSERHHHTVRIARQGLHGCEI